MRPAAQLLLFDRDAPPARPGAAIPAKRPVAGKSVCYRRDCTDRTVALTPGARATATKVAAMTTHAPMWRPEVDR